MRLTTILCQLTGTFAGFLSTVRYLPAVALVSYLFDRSHSWYTAFLKIFVLVQGTYTPLVIRHDRRTNAMHAELRWLASYTLQRRSPQPGDRGRSARKAWHTTYTGILIT